VVITVLAAVAVVGWTGLATALWTLHLVRIEVAQANANLETAKELLTKIEDVLGIGPLAGERLSRDVERYLSSNHPKDWL
jgi:hypothetical protein